MFHVSVIRVIPSQYTHHLDHIFMNDGLKKKHSLNHVVFKHFIEFPMSTSSYNQTDRIDTNSASLMEQCPSQLPKSNYVMKTSIFVLLGLAIVMLTIYSFVQVCFRKKVNTPIAYI